MTWRPSDSSDECATESVTGNQLPFTVSELADRIEVESLSFLIGSVDYNVVSYAAWIVSQARPAFARKLAALSMRIRAGDAPAALRELSEMHSSWSNQEVWLAELRAEVERRRLV